MKKVFILVAFVTILVNGCKKGNDIKADNLPAVIEKPTASFKIDNLVSEDLILEGNIVDFDNQSLQAGTYYWDFGNGIYSNDKIPQNISFVPCGGKYTISLVVTNKAGESRYAQTFDILCRGKSAHRAGPIKPIHVSTAQIASLGLSKQHS